MLPNLQTKWFRTVWQARPDENPIEHKRRIVILIMSAVISVVLAVMTASLLILINK